MEITLKLFGKFRLLGDEMSLVLSNEANVSDLRQALTEKLSEEDAGWSEDIRSSRFATDKQILLESTSLTDEMTVAIIPPVSGG